MKKSYGGAFINKQDKNSKSIVDNIMRRKRRRPMSPGPVLSLNVTVDNVYWPRWDTNEIYRFDFSKKDWIIHTSRPPTKFLFFSSICHLPLLRNPAPTSIWGMFILGGSDTSDNFSKRTQLFAEYRMFVEKAPIVSKRAFFPSVALSFQEEGGQADTLFVFGGNDGEEDLEICE